MKPIEWIADIRWRLMRPIPYIEDASHRFQHRAAWQEHVDHMERECPGFFRRNPLYAMSRRGGEGYQFGYEIGGYGRPIGPCVRHTHRTKEQAERCGRRWLENEVTYPEENQ